MGLTLLTFVVLNDSGTCSLHHNAGSNENTHSGGLLVSIGMISVNLQTTASSKSAAKPMTWSPPARKTLPLYSNFSSVRRPKICT